MNEVEFNRRLSDILIPDDLPEPSSQYEWPDGVLTGAFVGFVIGMSVGVLGTIFLLV